MSQTDPWYAPPGFLQAPPRAASPHFQHSSQQPGHHTFLGSSSQTACIQITSKSKGFSLPNTARMRLFLTASAVTVLAKPASHWEKKPCEQARRGLYPTPSFLHRSDAGLLVGPFSCLWVYASAIPSTWKPFCCVLSPPVPLLRESVTKHPVELFSVLLSPSFLVCFIFSHSMGYLLTCHFLYFHIAPFHLGPGTPERLYVLGWGGVLRYHLVCSLIYPQGAGHLLACNGCSGQIWKTGSVFALHEWKHRNVPLANRGQCLDATERLPGPATASRDSTRLKLLAQRGAAASLGLAQLSQVPFQAEPQPPHPQSPVRRGAHPDPTESYFSYFQLLSPQAWGSFLRFQLR